MLRLLIRWAVKNDALVAILAAAMLVVGVHNASTARLDVLPDFAPPQVVVQTEAPGFTAEQVELLITNRVEAALLGAPAAELVRSESIAGLSVITVSFRDDVDPWRARQAVGELLASSIGTLPEGSRPPQVTPLTSATMDLLKVGLLSDRATLRDLRAIAEWTVKPRLQAVPGVASVHIFGGDLPRLEVQVDDATLVARGLTLADVASAAGSATGMRPAGFVDTASQRVFVRSDGQATSPADLAEALVAERDGLPIRLGDVAKVVEGGEPHFGDCLIQGKPGVLLTLLGQYGTNTLEETMAVEAALRELAPVLEAAGVRMLPRLHRPATFIETALHNLTHSLWIGAALVAAVLLAFLRDLRTVAISLLAIPLSLLGAVLVLVWFGFGLDTMAIGGLAMAIGEVVDDAIVDVENVVRRLGMSRGRDQSRWRVVVAASLEVRGAVVHATMVVALAFVPVLLLPGLTGKLFRPLGVAYLVAVLCSLATALLVTPALCLLLFRRRPPRPPRERGPGLQAALLAFAHHHLNKLLVAMAVLLAATAWAGCRIGIEFLPAFREGHFVVQVTAAPGTSPDAMRGLGEVISGKLLADPRIATVEQQIGRAELGEDTWGTERSEFHVELATVAGSEMAEVEASIRQVLDAIPAVRSEVLTFLGDRIGESLGSEGKDLVVTVFGENLDELDHLARRTARMLATVPGIVDVRVGAEPGLPGYEVKLRRDRLAALGFTSREVIDDIEMSVQGRVVGQVHRGTQTENVVVLLDASRRRAPEQLGELLLRSANGTMARLADLAFVEPGSNRASILHEGGRRRQTISCNVRDVDPHMVAQEAERQVRARIPLPDAHYFSFAGSATEAAHARAELILQGGLACVAALVILAFAAGNLRNLLILAANLPFALVGGVAILWATDTPQSMGATIGFVTLFGITARNSIMLMSHFRHLVVVEGQPWNHATCARGAMERARPILMTALVTAVGLLPIASGRADAGREIEGPMALVILGGLCSSTALNFVLLPALFRRFGRFE